MKAATFEIEDKVDELLVVLDKDIEHIQDSLSRLNELRSLVVKRNEADLGKLLEGIQAEADNYRSHELRRESIRKELANALGCDLKQMTLSRLEVVVSEERKAQVATKKARLRELTKQLKKEHLSTAMLLSDCARFNSQLLSSVFDLGKVGIVCYDSKGSAKRGATEAFVNLQF
jgi:hypothetical protein